MAQSTGRSRPPPGPWASSRRGSPRPLAVRAGNEVFLLSRAATRADNAKATEFGARPAHARAGETLELTSHPIGVCPFGLATRCRSISISACAVRHRLPRGLAQHRQVTPERLFRAGRKPLVDLCGSPRKRPPSLAARALILRRGQSCAFTSSSSSGSTGLLASLSRRR